MNPIMRHLLLATALTAAVCSGCDLLPLVDEPSGPETVVLQPGPEVAEDALIRFHGTADTSNYGSHSLVNVHAWTNSGVPVIHRSLVEFDLEAIPSDAEVLSGDLYLYTLDPSEAFGSAWTGGCHREDGGTNVSYMRRVTSDWDEHGVHWENQPSTTRKHEVLLPGHISACQDYVVDVAQLVRDQLAAPRENLGLLIQLAEERPYRRLIFASSDFPDPSKWPKLEITYRR